MRSRFWPKLCALRLNTMNIIAVFTLILCAFCCWAQCKECPSKTKAHHTRCDSFYKCVLLKPGSPVWVPEKCDRGLVFEPTLELCVLPDDDWECSLGDDKGDGPTKTPQDDQSNVYVRNDLHNLQVQIDTYRPSKFADAAGLSSGNVEVISDFADNSNAHTENGNDSAEETDDNDQNGEHDTDDDSAAFGGSGDGALFSDESGADLQEKTTLQAFSPTRPTKGIATHLQRLTQLIESMAQAQQEQHDKDGVYVKPVNVTKPNQELGPTDLNAFLANHDIQTGVRHHLLSTNQVKQTIGMDGGIPDAHLSHILRLQANLQSAATASGTRRRRPATPTTTTPMPPTAPSLQLSDSDDTDQRNAPQHQIIVNRPGGTVVFSLPSTQESPTMHEAQATISDETLKAMLQLSKQLLTTSVAQNQNQPYPYIQPVYFNVPQQQHDYQLPAKYDVRPQSTAGQTNPTVAQEVSPTSADDRSTIIHNHIPITIQTPTRSTVKTAPPPRETQPPVATMQTHSSNMPPIENRYDSFSNKIPPTTFYQTDQPASSALPPSPAKPLYIYDSNTNFPATSKTLPTYQQQAAQAPPRPQMPFYASYPENFYPTQMHLSDQNVNSHVNVITPPYPTLRPTGSASDPNYQQHQYAPIVTNQRPTQQYHQQQEQQQPTQISDAISEQYNNIPEQQQPQQHHQQHHYNQQHHHDDELHPHHKYYVRPIDPHSTSSTTTQFYDRIDSHDDDNDDNANIDSDENEDDVDDGSNDQYSGGQQQQQHLHQYHQHQQPHRDNVMDPLLPAIARPSFSAQVANQFGTPNRRPPPQQQQQQQQISQPSSTLASAKFTADPPTASASSAAAVTNTNNRIVQYGGDAYMPYAEYQQSLAPLLSDDGREQIEVLNCVTGARQPSPTDCAKYFVCNAKTAKVMTYVCPQYTAFNADTRFCDARTYFNCKDTAGNNPGADDAAGSMPTPTAAPERFPTIEGNRRKQEMLLEKQQQQQRRQQLLRIQELKLQRQREQENAAAAAAATAAATAAAYELTTYDVLPDDTSNDENVPVITTTVLTNVPSSMKPPRRRRPRPTATNNGHRTGLPTASTTTTTSTTTPKPKPPKPMATPTVRPTPLRKPKPTGPIKRLIKCTEPTKVRDSLSVFNYFSCFKGADGELKAIKQTCPNGLIFCAMTKICTSKDRCKGQKMF